jgi:hypothetical protein
MFDGPQSGTAALARTMPQYGAMPGTVRLNPALAPSVPAGSPRPLAPGEWVQNPEGSWSSEISTTVTDPALNGGRPTIIPTLWLVDGKPTRVDEDTAVEYAKRSGLDFRGYDTPQAADKAADAREDEWQGLAPEQAGSVPALWQNGGYFDARTAALRMMAQPNSGTAALMTQPLAQPPTSADAWDYNVKAYKDWAEKQRQAGIQSGEIDPATNLPTAKGLFNPMLAGFVGSTAPELAPEVQGFRAYHGTPHDFDRFDLSKIGSGEGAQVFGHGLYFAEKEGTAKWYRDQLSPPDKPLGLSYNGVDIYRASPSQPPEGVSPEAWGRIRNGAFDLHSRLSRYKEVPPELIAEQRQYLANTVKNLENRQFEKGNVVDFYDRHALQDARDALMVLDDPNFTITPPVKSPGKMYEVGIAGSPDQLLHWDLPISEQSPHVQDALRKAGILPGESDYQWREVPDPEIEGETEHHLFHRDEPDKIRARIGTKWRNTVMHGRVPMGTNVFIGDRSIGSASTIDAMKQMAEEGVVPWQERQLRANYKKTGALLYKDLANPAYSDPPPPRYGVNDPVYATQKLREWGIPGIRYRDQGSRGSEGGTHNYVMFDDKMIDILRKYGIAGLMLGGSGTAALTRPAGGTAATMFPASNQ